LPERWPSIRNLFYSTNLLQALTQLLLKVTEEDVHALAKEMTAMQFRQYGLGNVADEHLENYANQMMKNEEERRKVVSKAQEDVIITAIKTKVALDIKEVSNEEFNKMLEN